MADFVFELWDKYWPDNIKGRQRVMNELAAILDEEGVTRGSVTAVRKFLPERFEVTVANINKTPDLDQYEITVRLGISGTQQRT